jgi:hypothetical protein
MGLAVLAPVFIMYTRLSLPAVLKNVPTCGFAHSGSTAILVQAASQIADKDISVEPNYTRRYVQFCQPKGTHVSRS